MEKLFCSYELSVKLKNIGFAEPCFAKYFYPEVPENRFRFNTEGSPKDYNTENYGRFVSAPLYQQVVDWLRENHDLNIGLTYFKIGTVSYWEYRIHYKDIYGQGGEYYHALNKAIEEALTLIKPLTVQ